MDNKYDEALKILQNLPPGLKEELSIINLTGTCFVQMGKHDLTLAFLEKGPVRKRKMDDDVIQFGYLLGVCYQEQGDNKKAVNQLQKIYAENVDLADVEERLKQLAAI
jgi:tetratricopeptide (TPR) repeat protein